MDDPSPEEIVDWRLSIDFPNAGIDPVESRLREIARSVMLQAELADRENVINGGKQFKHLEEVKRTKVALERLRAAGVSERDRFVRGLVAELARLEAQPPIDRKALADRFQQRFARGEWIPRLIGLGILRNEKDPAYRDWRSGRRYRDDSTKGLEIVKVLCRELRLSEVSVPRLRSLDGESSKSAL